MINGILNRTHEDNLLNPKNPGSDILHYEKNLLSLQSRPHEPQGQHPEIYAGGRERR